MRLDVDLGRACWIRTELVLLSLISIQRREAFNQRSKLVFSLLSFYFFLFFSQSNLAFILFDFFEHMDCDVGTRDNVHRCALLL